MTEASPAPADASATRSTSRRLGGHFLALLGAAAATRLVSLGSQVTIARLLGPESLGAVAIATSMLTLANILTDGGLTTLTLREVVRTPEGRPTIASATLVLQTLFALVCIGGLAIIAVLGQWRGNTGLLIVLFSPTLLFAAFGLGYLLQAAEYMGTLALSRVVASVVPAVLSVILVAATHQPGWIAAATCLGFLAADLLIWRKLRKATELVLVRPPRAVLRSLLVGGRPYLVTSVLLIVPAVAGTISVGIERSSHDVGVYNAVWQLTFALTSVAALLVDAIYPEMVRRWDDGRLADFLSLVVRLSLRVTLPGAVVVSFAAVPLTRLVLGPDFSAAAPVLRVLVWMVPLGFVWALIGQGVNAADGARSLVRPNIVLAIFAVVGCLLAAARSGPVAVAGVMLAGYALQVGAYLTIASRRGALGRPFALALELPFAVVPAAGCLAVHTLGGSLPLYLLAGFAGLMIAEPLAGCPTLRLLRRAARASATAESAPPAGGRHRRDAGAPVS